MTGREFVPNSIILAIGKEPELSICMRNPENTDYPNTVWFRPNQLIYIDSTKRIMKFRIPFDKTIPLIFNNRYSCVFSQPDRVVSIVPEKNIAKYFGRGIKMAFP